MKQKFSLRPLAVCMILAALPLGARADDAQQATQAQPAEAAAPAQAGAASAAGDVVARVGDQTITFSEINTMLNSSAVVGLSLPALGTPERDTVRITLLDKIISANLLYLDALRKGLDADPVYRSDMQRFGNSILAELYYQKYLVGDIAISEEEIQAEYREPGAYDGEFSTELRAVIEASLRKRKLAERQAELRGKLRDEVEVAVYQKNFSPGGDDGRDDAAPVAEVGDETITWGEIKERLTAAGKGAVMRDPLAMEVEARLGWLQNEIDTRLLAQRARAAGMENDPVFRKRIGEYGKTRLVNLHRAGLAEQMDPREAELQAYFEANRAQIAMPEFRKVQIVMLETEQQARDLKQRIEDGEMTIYEAASAHSVAPDAKQNLGELGWIGKGKTRPELDAVIFALQPAEIGGPVEAGGLWHLVSVLDVRDAQYDDLAQESTRKLVRRKYIHEKLDDYVVNLRRNDFPVEVYEDRLIALAQQEADMVRALAESSGNPSSVTQQRIEEMRKLMTP